jgi:hypothetical protein
LPRAITLREMHHAKQGGDVSTLLGVPVGTLYQWRRRHIGPPDAKVVRHLRYDPAKVRSWLAEQVA